MKKSEITVLKLVLTRFLSDVSQTMIAGAEGGLSAEPSQTPPPSKTSDGSNRGKQEVRKGANCRILNMVSHIC